MDNFLDINNVLDNTRNCLENIIDLGKEQNEFLKSQFGTVVDNAVNIGLKSILPDFIENQVIDVKDAILQDGIKGGIDEAISSSIDLGKSLIGIFTGNFETVSQIQNAVKKGGMIDAISSVIDKGIDVAVSTGLVDKNIGNVISSGKKTIFKNISNNIENSLENQINSVEKIEKYCEKWNSAYKNQDLETMKKEFKNINKQLENIVPLESTISKAREIENLQKIIENNGGNFNISYETLELAKVL